MIYLHAFGKHFLIRSTDYRISLKLERSMYSVCMDSPEKWFWVYDSPARVSSTIQAGIAILLANRQVSEEAAHVLYSTSTFHFDDPESLAVFLLATPERHLAITKRVTITIILHPEQSVPALWVHYISIAVLFKMRQLKNFEVGIWATYPETPQPHLRRSRHFTRLKNSKSMPFLERGTVAFIGDKPRKRRADRDTMSPGRLAQDMMQLIKGEPSESDGLKRWTLIDCSHPTTVTVSLTKTKSRTPKESCLGPKCHKPFSLVRNHESVKFTVHSCTDLLIRDCASEVSLM